MGPPAWNVRRVPTIGEEWAEVVAEYPNVKDAVRPVDHKPAPDHQEQDREVDPVKPTDRQRMFLLDDLRLRYGLGSRFLSHCDHRTMPARVGSTSWAIDLIR